jgi:uncharacterized cupredoxin-like copper-binding protein
LTVFIGAALGVGFLALLLVIFFTPQSAFEPTDNGTGAAPAATEDPMATEAPAATGDPDATEEPAATEDTDATEEPAATEDTDATEEPTATEDTDATEEPTATEDTDATEEPTATEDTDATEEPTATEDTDATEEPTPTEDTDAGSGDAGSGDAGAELTVSSTGLELAFEQTTLEAPANTTVSLTYDNNSDVLQHNWILVDGGRDLATEINNASQANAANNFLPPEGTEGVIAQTPTLDPNASETITFETPGPGTYLYICTFPGHYVAGMIGDLIVE